MENITTIATPSAARFCMPALPGIPAQGATVDGGRTAAGTSHAYGVTVSAFLKGAFSGVRAWSPPV